MMETQTMATASQPGPRRPGWSPPTTRGACSNTGASAVSWARYASSSGAGSTPR